jgi:hypothetical protein
MVRASGLLADLHQLLITVTVSGSGTAEGRHTTVHRAAVALNQGLACSYQHLWHGDAGAQVLLLRVCLAQC